MFSFVLFLLALGVNARSLPKFNFGGRSTSHFLQKNSATAHWDSMTAVSLDATPNGYFMAHQFKGGGGCSGSQTMVLATATGICFQGTANGTAVGSIVYNLGSVDRNSFTINLASFTSLDCSGDATYAPMVIPTTCLVSEDDNSDYDYAYSYTSDTTPWTSYDKGLVIK